MPYLRYVISQALLTSQAIVSTNAGFCLTLLWGTWRLQGQRVLFKAPVIPDLRVDSEVRLQYCRGRAFAEVTNICGELLSPLNGLNPLLSVAGGRPSLPVVTPTVAQTISGTSWLNAVTPSVPSKVCDSSTSVALLCASRQRINAHAAALV